MYCFVNSLILKFNLIYIHSNRHIRQLHSSYLVTIDIVEYPGLSIEQRKSSFDTDLIAARRRVNLNSCMISEYNI